MSVKPVILSALVALGAMGAPVEGVRMAQFAQPTWISPVQDRRGQEVRPLREVVAELRARYGGDLIDARLEDGARPVYLIRWRMPDGQVRDFRVDAAR